MLALIAFAGAPAASSAGSTIRVGNEPQFQAAVSALSDSGGTIVLLPNLYRELIVPPRSARWLRIVGMPGARVERVLFDHTQYVSLGRMVISPRMQNATVEVRGLQHVELPTPSSPRTERASPPPSSCRIRGTSRSVGARSRTAATGHRSLRTACSSYRWSHHITVEDNRFHDCHGCDFIHGRFGSRLTLRRNRFERALPCRIGRVGCAHQDLVELFAGNRLRVERNHFGVHKFGGAQLYITGPMDHVAIVNNVFIGTDPRVPGYRVADRARHRLAGIATSAAVRQSCEQHDPDGRHAQRRIHRIGPDEPCLPVRGLPAACAATCRQQRHRPPPNG